MPPSKVQLQLVGSVADILLRHSCSASVAACNVDDRTVEVHGFVTTLALEELVTRFKVFHFSSGSIGVFI